MLCIHKEKLPLAGFALGWMKKNNFEEKKKLFEPCNEINQLRQIRNQSQTQNTNFDLEDMNSSNKRKLKEFTMGKLFFSWIQFR